jgi:hypothetical protein
MNTELKPCPFCGGQPTWRTTKIRMDQNGNPYQNDILLCAKPHCDVKPRIESNIKQKALEAWNKRSVGNQEDEDE